MGENKCRYCKEDKNEQLIMAVEGNSLYHQTCHRINKMELFSESYGLDSKSLTEQYFKGSRTLDSYDDECDEDPFGNKKTVEGTKCFICREDKKEKLRYYKANAFLPVHESCTITATEGQKRKAEKLIEIRKSLIENGLQLSNLNNVLGNALDTFKGGTKSDNTTSGKQFPDLTRKEVNQMIQGKEGLKSHDFSSNARKQGEEIPSGFINPLKHLPDEIKKDVEVKLVGDEYQINVKPTISDSIDEVDSFPCWFCGKHEGEMVFDTEFDTPLHLNCLKKELEVSPDNPEAQIMKYLLEEDKDDYLEECYLCHTRVEPFTMSSYRPNPDRQKVGNVCADCARKPK